MTVAVIVVIQFQSVNQRHSVADVILIINSAKNSGPKFLFILEACKKVIASNFYITN